MYIRHLIYSAICIGIANILIDWFFIGFLFHKYQALTPQTWRKESNLSYTKSSILSLVFGLLFSFFYFKIGSRYVIFGNLLSACKFGFLCFICFAALIELSNAIYINYHKKFTIAKLLASLFTYLAAAIIACLFY